MTLFLKEVHDIFTGKNQGQQRGSKNKISKLRDNSIRQTAKFLHFFDTKLKIKFSSSDNLCKLIWR